MGDDKPRKVFTVDDIARSAVAAEDALVADQPVSREVWQLTHALHAVHPQLQARGVGGNWNYPDPRSAMRLMRDADEKLVAEPPPFGTLPLARGAPLTDVLSSTTISRGLVVSERAKEIFRKFNLGEHRFFPLLVQSDDGIHEYDWLQFVNDAAGSIAFDRSEFFAEFGYSASAESCKAIRGESWEDVRARLDEVRNKVKDVTRLQPKNVVLSGRSDAPDLFRLGFDLRHYVTTRLKDALQHHAVTGLTFKQTRRVRFESEV